MFAFCLSKQWRQLCAPAINSCINTRTHTHTHAVDSCYITAAMLHLKQVKRASVNNATVGRFRVKKTVVVVVVARGSIYICIKLMFRSGTDASRSLCDKSQGFFF